MRAGRIVEEGTHTRLLAFGGLYAELYALQAAGYRDHPVDAMEAEKPHEPDEAVAPDEAEDRRRSATPA